MNGAEGDRTPDLCSAIAALSQLSYRPGQATKLVTSPEPVNRGSARADIPISLSDNAIETRFSRRYQKKRAVSGNRFGGNLVL